MDRRYFLQAGSVAGGALLLPGLGAQPARANPEPCLPAIDDPRYLTPIADPCAIPRFVNALPRPTRVDVQGGGSRTLLMGPALQDVIGGGLGLLTPVWGFGARGRRDRWGDGPVTYPGPTLVARRNRPVRVHWANALPYRHLLPVDTTVHWAFSHTAHAIAQDGVPAVVHLHGGHTGPDSDGHPEAWYTPRGATGPRFYTTRFQYDNTQEAATLWYHDHALGITRLNVHAGLAGFYLLRDDEELALIAHNRLPGGPYERELVLQDRMFHPDGRLAYPDVPNTSPDWPGGPSLRAEFFGQVIVVNGKAWPYLEVEPRQYRLRLLNGSGSRTYRLSVDGQWPFPVTQLGTDGGFLFRPHPLDAPLVLAPAERVDLIADFRDLAGATFTLTNDAPTPYPFGAPVAPPADAVLQIRVNQPYDKNVPEPQLPPTLRDTPYEIAGVPDQVRRLVLFEGLDDFGRPKPMLGTVEQGVLEWSEPITEDPRLRSTEIWEIYNSTGDLHPIHVHLVQFQVLDRARFTAERNPSNGALSHISVGAPRPPDATELGPKDTVQTFPGQVTRVKAVFDKRGVYVWHCHILEHEDHEMMRNYEVS